MVRHCVTCTCPPPAPEINAMELHVEYCSAPDESVIEGPRGVTLTHIPTGITRSAHAYRSQLQNKMQAYEELREILVDSGWFDS